MVANLLHQQNVMVTPQDVYNMRTQSRFTGTSDEELLKVLQQQNLTYTVHTLEDGEVSCISWTSPTQQQLLQRYGEVIMLDGTYSQSATYASVYYCGC